MNLVVKINTFENEYNVSYGFVFHTVQ